MRHLLLVITVLLGLQQSAVARGIVGKWYCSRSFLDSLYLSAVCVEYSGTFDFLKDGKFRLKVSGSSITDRGYASASRGKASRRRGTTLSKSTLYVRVSGRYRVENGLITTEFDPADVKCYSNSGIELPDMADATLSNAELRYMEYTADKYAEHEKKLDEYKQFVVSERSHIWKWSNRKFTVTDSVLLVDGGIRLTAEREKPAAVAQAGLSPHLALVPESRGVANAIMVLSSRKSSPGQLRAAVSRLESAVAADSAANLMFSLANVYLYGRGVEADGVRAAYLMRKAASAGYAKAYYALGLIYKEGRGGVGQDFGKAYACFDRGAKSGNRQCLHAKGYMLYKGLGCEQDYGAAVRTFREAAGMKEGQSWYMLGICYRNGFGCMQDSAKADYCLRRAIGLKCRDARGELGRRHEETYLSDVYGDDERYSYLPIPMPDIIPAPAGAKLAGGDYEGFMVMYDYSGDRLVMQKPVRMSVRRDGPRVSGMMAVGADTVSFSGEICADGKLKFTSGRLTLDERYEISGALEYNLDYMVFDDIAGKLCGRLGLYSVKLREPGRPVYVELVGSGSGVGSAR